MTPQAKKLTFTAAIWLLRIAVGATFVMSGLVKMIDPWGFVYKIEEYLWVWNIHQPRTIEVAAAMLISGYEFVLGLLLAMGCYKRSAPWLLLLQMAVMLPLTLYIWVADPVDDCGCFGDFIHLSNAGTFLKNVVLTAALVVLAIYNPRLKQSMFTPAIQWMVGAWITLYILIVGLYGYNVQPMIDFRPYPKGAPLTAEADLDPSDYSFLYEKDGHTVTFTIDNLPDSTWEFVERVAPAADSPLGSAFTIYDPDTGDDVTDEVILTSGPQLLLVIAEPLRADVAYSYTINEIQQHADSLDIPLVALIAGDARRIDLWRDLAMAEYPIYTADDTKLKELVRGNIALVLLRDGYVESKLDLRSFDPQVIEAPESHDQFLAEFYDEGHMYFVTLTLVFGGILIAMSLFQGLILALRQSIARFFRRWRPAAERR